MGPACHGVFPFRKRPPMKSAAGAESDVRQWHRGFGMRRLGPACHGVFPFRKRRPKQSPAGSESDVRQWHRGGTGMPFTRLGSSRQSRQLHASKASFRVGSESDVRHWQQGLGSAVATSMPWCFPVSEAAAEAVSRAQKATLQKLVF